MLKLGRAPHREQEQRARENQEWNEREHVAIMNEVMDQTGETLTFPKFSVGPGASLDAVQELCGPSARDCVIHDFQVYVRARDATATDPTIVIYNETSVVSQTPITDVVVITSAPATYTVQPRKAGLAKGDILGVRCTTDATDGFLQDVRVSFWTKPRWRMRDDSGTIR